MIVNVGVCIDTYLPVIRKLDINYRKHKRCTNINVVLCEESMFAFSVLVLNKVITYEKMT